MSATSDRISDQQALQAAGCACFNMRKAVRVVTQLYDDLLRPTGIRGTQFTLLTAIRLLQPVTINRLAEAVVTDRTTLTRNLKPLERDGLITIQPGSDRRMREASLTEAGEQALAAAYPRWQEAQRKISESLGKERLGHLLEDLAATVEAVRD